MMDIDKPVDIVRKEKKLYVKENSIPDDYSKHIIYLYTNDYVQVYKNNGELKFEGYVATPHFMDYNIIACQMMHILYDI